MEVKNCEVKPYEEHISPALRFDMKIGYQKYEEAIIGVKGWLKASDGKIIANVEEIETQSGGEIAAKRSHFDSEFKKDVYETTIIAILSREALETINNYRMENRKGDVEFFLELAVRCLKTKALVSHLYEVGPERAVGREIQVPTSKGEEKGRLIISAYDPGFSSSSRNMWVISGNGKPSFLAEEDVKLKEKVKVSASDWIHDYAPKLGLGKYFIVEVPREGVIRDAWNYVEEAEECFRSWDTEGVFAKCREIGDLLNETLRSELGEGSFAYKEKWGRVYGEFKHSASLYLHKEEKKEEYPPRNVRVGKEDADFILISAKSLIKYAEDLLQVSADTE